MLYAKVNKKGKVIKFPLDETALRRELGATSLPADLEDVDLSHLGIERVEMVEPPKPRELHRVELGDPERVDGGLVRTFRQVPLSPDDIRMAWRGVRSRRIQLLRQTDWTQLPDVPMDEDARREWAVYRQALRDVPQTHVDPTKIVWPRQPG